ncbi:MAG TPA: nuclear transport factor 2 family protein, partial [Chthoniobacterales bacterium]|nr:nuclear transport factor 2 family protein [Chthoniobacterales bacterium]
MKSRTIRVVALLFSTMTITAAELSPEALVQAQLEAYNARDLEAFAATYSENAELIELPDTVIARGAAELRERYAKVFADETLHAQVVNRIVVGNTVVDHERVSRTFAEGRGTLEAIAMYVVENGKITRVWFRRGELKLEVPRLDR